MRTIRTSVPDAVYESLRMEAAARGLTLAALLRLLLTERGAR